MPLRLTALGNEKIKQIERGEVDCNSQQEAAHILNLSLKALRSPGFKRSETPVKLIPSHAKKSTAEGRRRLNHFVDCLGDLAIDHLSNVIRTRKRAQEYCKLFNLGQEGMQLWRQCRHDRKHNTVKKSRLSRVQPPKDTAMPSHIISGKPKTKSRRRKTPTPKRALLDDTHSTTPIHYAADDDDAIAVEERFVDSNTIVFQQPPSKLQKSRFFTPESAAASNHSILSKNFKLTSSITVADPPFMYNDSMMQLDGKMPLPVSGDGMGAARRHSDVLAGSFEGSKDAWQSKDATAVVGILSRGLATRTTVATNV